MRVVLILNITITINVLNEKKNSKYTTLILYSNIIFFLNTRFDFNNIRMFNSSSYNHNLISTIIQNRLSNYKGYTYTLLRSKPFMGSEDSASDFR